MPRAFDCPCWYVATIFLLVAFHVGRGMIGQTYLNAANPFNPNYSSAGRVTMERWQAVWVFYAHDALLHLLCTVFGAACLWYAYSNLEHASSSPELTGLLLLSVVGLAGVTGQLGVALTLGKIPTG